MSDNARRFRYIQLELTDSCDLRCSFCYNVWKETERYPRGRLKTQETLALISKIVSETDCEYISLTGGEPLLRKDIYKIIEFIASRDVKVILITNGQLLSKTVARSCIEAGLTSFEVSLHSYKADVHDRLVGSQGAFEKAVSALAAVANCGGHAGTVFVATASNVEDFARTVELNALLHSRFVLFNRVACGGDSLETWDNMVPSPAQIREALQSSLSTAAKYEVGIGIGVQIPPCLLDLSDMDGVAFKFCPLNEPLKEHTYITVDPRGNLRMCNRSAFVLGNVLTDDTIPRLMQSEVVTRFSRAIPSFCRGCRHEAVCGGGCRADAHSRWGTFDRPDPWVEKWKAQAAKPTAYVQRSPID